LGDHTGLDHSTEILNFLWWPSSMV